MLQIASRVYEACTRSTPTNKTDYYWCPSKEQADADKEFNRGAILHT